MVKRETMPDFFEYENLINKTQRYACLRKLIKNDTFTAEIQALVDKERTKDYSAQDDVEYIRLQASRVV